jgi:hypothetical protein
MLGFGILCKVQKSRRSTPRKRAVYPDPPGFGFYRQGLILWEIPPRMPQPARTLYLHIGFSKTGTSQHR